MHFTYILYSKKLKKRYIGVTENLVNRLKQHKSKAVPFTSKAEDWKLLYYEVFISKEDAYREEQFLKTGKGRDRIKYLLQSTMNKII
jgi:putative endonuclease